MTNENELFIEAYGRNVAETDAETVEAILADTENAYDNYRDEYSSVMDALGMYGAGLEDATKLLKLAQVRPDILKNGEAVPVGDSYIGDNKLYKYRCPTEDTLEIWFEGKWQEAVNIDWDFPEFNQK